MPFWTLARPYQSLHIIKPEFNHTIKIRWPRVTRNIDPMALHESAQTRDPGAHWTMNIFPIMEEIFIRHPWLFGNTVHELYHCSSPETCTVVYNSFYFFCFALARSRFSLTLNCTIRLISA